MHQYGYDYNNNLMRVISSHYRKKTPNGQLNAGEIAEVVWFSLFKMAFPVTLLRKNNIIGITNIVLIIRLARIARAVDNKWFSS